MGCKFYFGAEKKEKEGNEMKKEKKIAKDRDAQRWKEWRGRVEKAILSGENRGRLHDGAFFGKKQQAKRYETCSNVWIFHGPSTLLAKASE